MRLQDTGPGTKFRIARVVHDVRFVLPSGGKREKEEESFHFRRERAKVLDPIAVALSLPNYARTHLTHVITASNGNVTAVLEKIIYTREVRNGNHVT